MNEDNFMFGSLVFLVAFCLLLAVFVEYTHIEPQHQPSIRTYETEVKCFVDGELVFPPENAVCYTEITDKGVNDETK